MFLVAVLALALLCLVYSFVAYNREYGEQGLPIRLYLTDPELRLKARKIAAKLAMRVFAIFGVTIFLSLFALILDERLGTSILLGSP